MKIFRFWQNLTQQWTFRNHLKQLKNILDYHFDPWISLTGQKWLCSKIEICPYSWNTTEEAIVYFIWRWGLSKPNFIWETSNEAAVTSKEFSWLKKQKCRVVDTRWSSVGERLSFWTRQMVKRLYDWGSGTSLARTYLVKLEDGTVVRWYSNQCEGNQMVELC